MTTTYLIPARAFGHKESEVFQEFVATVEITPERAIWLIDQMGKVEHLKEEYSNTRALVLEQRIGPLYSQDEGLVQQITSPTASSDRPPAEWVRAEKTELHIGANSVHWQGRDAEGLYVIETSPLSLDDLLIYLGPAYRIAPYKLTPLPEKGLSH